MNWVLLDVTRCGPAWRSHGVRLKRLAHQFLRRLKLDNAELSLALVRDRHIRALNAEWRGKDRATDVLSFPFGEQIAPGRRPLGDVVISVDTAKRAAPEFDSTIRDELDRYLAHGLLHLLGHDHHSRREARAMQRLENALLGDARGGMLSRSDEVE